MCSTAKPAASGHAGGMGAAVESAVTIWRTAAWVVAQLNSSPSLTWVLTCWVWYRHTSTDVGGCAKPSWEPDRHPVGRAPVVIAAMSWSYCGQPSVGTSAGTTTSAGWRTAAPRRNDKPNRSVSASPGLPQLSVGTDGHRTLPWSSTTANDQPIAAIAGQPSMLDCCGADGFSSGATKAARPVSATSARC